MAGESMKIKVAKLVLSPQWYADCPCCPSDTGFFTSRRWWLCLMWAKCHRDEHIAAKKIVEATK